MDVLLQVFVFVFVSCLCQLGLAGTGQSRSFAQSNSMLNREPCTHSSKSSSVSSGQLTPRRLCVLRQSYTLVMLNIVYMKLEMAIPDDWDPGDPEQSAYSNSTPDRDTRAHSSTSSTVSSGQLSPTPCVLRQSDILNTMNIVQVQLETAEHVSLVAVT